MNEISTGGARVALGVLLLGTLLAQVLVPQLAAELGGSQEEVAHLVVPYSAAALVAIACVQGALVAVWRLLALAGRDEIFTGVSLRWADGFTVLAAAATLVAAGPMLHLLGVVGVGGPGVALALGACVACGATLVLVARVARQVLERAVAYRRALDTLERAGTSRSRPSPGELSRP